MVSTSGAQLLPEDAVETLIQHLLPLTTVLTPNLPEARLLLKTAGVTYEEPQKPGDLIRIANSLQQLGPKYVLLKGGHIPLTRNRTIATHAADHHIVFNVLASKDSVVTFESD